MEPLGSDLPRADRLGAGFLAQFFLEKIAGPGCRRQLAETFREPGIGLEQGLHGLLLVEEDLERPFLLIRNSRPETARSVPDAARSPPRGPAVTRKRNRTSSAARDCAPERLRELARGGPRGERSSSDREVRTKAPIRFPPDTRNSTMAARSSTSSTRTAPISSWPGWANPRTRSGIANPYK